MATLPQPYAEQQQPALAYPDTAHSNGSFGSVFIVLAVIIVVSAVACCLERVCSKSKHGGKEHKQGKKKKDKKDKKDNNKKSNNKHQNSKVGQSDDIEFGFDKGSGGGGFPPMGRPVAGKREGPNGPHFKQPSAAAESNHYGSYFPSGPPPPKSAANHQQSVHRGV